MNDPYHLPAIGRAEGTDTVTAAAADAAAAVAVPVAVPAAVAVPVAVPAATAAAAPDDAIPFKAGAVGVASAVAA